MEEEWVVEEAEVVEAEVVEAEAPMKAEAAVEAAEAKSCECLLGCCHGTCCKQYYHCCNCCNTQR